jgi:hypothetical protein
MVAGSTVGSGILSLIVSAAQGRSDGVKFLLDGDLSQMSTQEEFLKARGFNVGRSNVYPGLFTEDDFKRALAAIWESRVSGWWHYQAKYVEYGICTSEEFQAALKVEGGSNQ